MRLAISNIAWDAAEDEAVCQLLHRHGLDAIDVAHSKYFQSPDMASTSDIHRVRDWWAERGIEITGMQSLLFGTQGLNVFGSDESRAQMLSHLEQVCRIGQGLGASRLVFGSPRNRDRQGLTDEVVQSISLPFWRRLGDIAAKHGVCICLEPNPTCYGANFMTTAEETAQVVMAVNHPAIRMQLDTGAMHINAENCEDFLARHADLIGHVHASEPQLVPLGDADTAHADIHMSLLKHLPHHVVTVEMLATAQEPHLQSIDRALAAAVMAYRPSMQDPQS
jgi:D-psicose/D-tagatose/L-ribulose 3-epimerase